MPPTGRMTAFCRRHKKTSEQSGLCSDVARGNNPNPLRLSAVLLEEYPIGLLAGGAFAPYKRFAAGKTLRRGNSLAPSIFHHRRVELPSGRRNPKKKDICFQQMSFFFAKGG